MRLHLPALALTLAVALAGCSHSRALDPDRRYALVVTVADYPGDYDDLEGPTVDGEAVRSLLVDDYGYVPSNVLVLRDREATRDAVAAAFRAHLGQAGERGSALYFFSGHGTQVPVGALPETVRAVRREGDDLDEALVLWGEDGDFSYLLDHELGALAEATGARHTLVALDNCNSGDGTRGEDDRVPEGAAIRLLPFDRIAPGLAAPDALLSDDLAVGAERHALLAASRAEQPSLELPGLAPDGGVAGVFTTSLVGALRDADPETTLAALVESLRPDVRRKTSRVMDYYGYLPQQPQAEGAQASARVADVLGRRVGDE